MTKTIRRGSLLVLVLAFGALAPADPQAADPNRALAREQLDLIEKVQKRLAQPSVGSRAASDLWARRKIEALRAAGAEKNEMIAALEGYLNVMKKREEGAKRLLASNAVSETEVWEDQYHRIEAEMWLNQEKAQ